MHDPEKSRAELLDELKEARGEIAELKAEAGSDASRSKAAEALRESEERFRTAFESTSDCILIWDREYNYLYANRAAIDHVGTTLDEVIGKNIRERLGRTPDLMEVWINRLDQVFDSGEVLHVQDRSEMVGRWRNTDSILSPLRDERGEVVAVCVVYRDITDLKTAQSWAQRFSRVLEQSLNEIYLFDDETLCFVEVNRGARENLGYSMHELSSMTPVDIKPEFSAERFTEVVEPLRSGATEKIEFFTVHQRKDGTTYPVEVHLQRLTDGAPVFVAIILDITERIELKREKSRLEEQYQQAQKMEAIGRLAGGVAHDFNNVLCAITGNASLLSDELAAEDPMRGVAEEITMAAERAAELTRQLLTVSRKQIIEPRVINLSHLIESLHSMLVRLIGEDIILRTVPQKGLASVRADPGQMEQIVLNLAVNARDAMPDGGELVIQTADVSLDAADCKNLTDVTPGDYVELAVSDTGVGMDAETRSKIYEPFFTTKQQGEGTGLGLATVFGIVERHGGRIEVTSELGEGSSFRVYLPRVLIKAEDITRETKAVPAGGTEIVLLVEDEDIVRKLAVRLLTRRGYNVLAASSGAEALDLAERYEGDIHVLLTDVVMPRMNGRELSERVLRLRPEIKVLFTSGYDQDVIAHHGVLEEGLHFLAKPYAVNELAARVREVLDGSS